MAQREALAAAEKRAHAAEVRAAAAENEAKSHALLIEKLKFTIAKLRHAQFGQSAERGAILEQLSFNSLTWKRMRRKHGPKPNSLRPRPPLLPKSTL